MIAPAYTYRAVVKKVHDGDTVTLDIDLGLTVWLRNQSIRLFGINAPELKQKLLDVDGPGERSRDFLAATLASSTGKPLIIETHKDNREKYGRWLGVLWLDGQNINDLMLAKGFALPV